MKDSNQSETSPILKKDITPLLLAFFFGAASVYSYFYYTTPSNLNECIAKNVVSAKSDKGALIAQNACRREFPR